ncbi:MAG: glycosyltransferase [bacterium]
MPETFIDPNPFLLTLFLVFCFCFLVQMGFYWGIFSRLGTKAPVTSHQSPVTSHPPGVSVVICAHNEQHHLQKVLPQILEQDYPEYEVVVVNHASDDDTSFLLSGLADKYPHLKVVDIKEDLNFFTGKKFPLSIGIRSARYDTVLLTDADCRPAGNQWIRSMSRAFTDRTKIVLGYGPYERRKGTLNKLIRFDTVQVAIQYLSFALAGIPYMGIGRNLAYKKALFFREKGFTSHYRISSGDDDLFINQVARKQNTAVATDPASFTWSEPKTSLGRWITQKRRHFSTGSHYKFKHQFLLGLYAGTQLGFWILLILLLTWKFAWLFVFGVLLLKWISQYVVFGRWIYRLQEYDLIVWIPLLEWVLLILQTGIGAVNLIRHPRKWK